MGREPVAVLVTDQRMPEMTGHDLLVQVKEQFPTTVRMVVTAYSDLDSILQAVNQGLVARYIIKPWDRAELTEILRWAIQLHELGEHDSMLLLRLMVNERLATLGSIAGAILHDLNHPLSLLQMDSERLAHHGAAVAALEKLIAGASVKLASGERGKLLELAEELPSMAADMGEASSLMRRMIDGLLQFMRAESTAKDAHTDPLLVIRTAMRLCNNTTLEAHGRIVYDGPSKLPEVRIDATRLSQVLINLLSNAIHALPARGGKVLVRAAALAAEKMVRFTVEDNGAGMTPEVLEQVGTRFFTTSAKGTGLGIEQCRRLVGSAGGGELQIRSDEGKGTAVTFQIPCV
jgi:signal transduction histidine kinase